MMSCCEVVSKDNIDFKHRSISRKTKFEKKIATKLQQKEDCNKEAKDPHLVFESCCPAHSQLKFTAILVEIH